MLKLLFSAVLVAALAAAVAVVPLGGRTVLERWRAARDPSDFVARGLRELEAAAGPVREAPRPSRAHASRPARPARAPAITEEHRDSDRAALDRIVAEHAGR